MGYLTEEERRFIREMKRVGVLGTYTRHKLQNITCNGGVSVFCGDGDIDVRNWHEKTITNRPHAMSHFGGVLIHSPLFKGYSQEYDQGAIANMGWGLEAKSTQSALLYPHFPCGVATKFEHPIEEVFLMSAQVHLRFLSELGFTPDKVHSFFHVKRMNRGQREEQNTYVFDVQKYVSLIGAKIVSLQQAQHLPIAA